MALMPRRVKHRKSQRRRIKGNATRGNTVAYGDWGLQSMEAGHVKATTIEVTAKPSWRTLIPPLGFAGTHIGSTSRPACLDRTPPRHLHVHHRAEQEEDQDGEQAASHVTALARPDSSPPHSVQTAASPIGYAHFGQRPRLTRTKRRRANGLRISSQRIVA